MRVCAIIWYNTRMQIRQISIFLQNQPGQLSQICRALADAGYMTLNEEEAVASAAQ